MTTTSNTIVVKWREPLSPFAARDQHGRLLVHYLTLHGLHQHGGKAYYTNGLTHCGIGVAAHLSGDMADESEPVTCDRCREIDAGSRKQEVIDEAEAIVREAQRPQPVAA